MTDVTQRTVLIVNKLGLHARAAAKFVSLASQFDADISVQRGERTVNGKSIMGIMMLAASKGTEILIRARGEDAEEALEQLHNLIQSKFGEAE